MSDQLAMWSDEVQAAIKKVTFIPVAQVKFLGCLTKATADLGTYRRHFS